jgi:hypothetical protein
MADKIQHAQSLSRMKALEVAAQQAGFAGFKQAQKQLNQSMKMIEVCFRWHDTYGTKAFGIETLTYPFKKSLQDLLGNAKRRTGLGLFYTNGENCLFGHERETGQSQARLYVCEAMRKLMFMEATGLMPEGSGKKVKSWPTVRWTESGRRHEQSMRIPGSDHTSVWGLPDSKHGLIINEPYGAVQADTAHAQLEWLSKHGFEQRLARWGGLYNPEGGTVMYLLAHQDSGFDLDTVCATINSLPDDFGPKQWPGISRSAKNMYEPGKIIVDTTALKA